LRALLVDGLNLIRRVYAGVPGDQHAEEHLQAAINSCVASLRRALRDHEPSHAICVLEDGGKSWRHDLLSSYKQDRPPIPALLNDGLPRICEQFEQEGVRCISVPGFEADDVLATLAHKIAAHKGKVIVLSTDKSMCQLVSDGIQVYDHFDGRFLDEKYIQEKFKVRPDQLSIVFALAGDGSLGIRGVKNVGLKTAAKLVAKYGDLDSISSAANDIPGKLGQNLSDCAQDAHLAQCLMTLRTDVEVGINLKELRIASIPF
jgi:5'-3' exonuclease